MLVASVQRPLLPCEFENFPTFTLQQLMYEDLSADEYRILGLDERHSPVIVGPCEVEVAAAADAAAADELVT